MKIVVKRQKSIYHRTMTIIVGLGNPGKKFDHTRHNAGFEVLDFFAKENNFSEDQVLLIKPQTFMNESGKAVEPYKFKVNDLIVVHDDIDMPLGKIKFVKDSTSGGHKGVESIIQTLGTKDFARLKIGVATGDHDAMEVVLQKFSPEEQELLAQVIKKSAEALRYLIENGLEKAMNEYNK